MLNTLPALQALFQQALLDADEAVPTALAARLLPGPVAGFGVAERLHIYRHAYMARLTEALRESFGHSARYLDAQFDGKGVSAFDRLAAAYVQSHPSAMRNINAYGQDWPRWLGEHLARWPELSELAGLDWQLRRSFDGPDGMPLTLQGLAACVGEPGWEWQPLRPVPTFGRLQFSTNALALWHAMDQDAPVPAAATLAAPLTVVVWRVGERPHFRSVEPFEARALDALVEQGSFGAMCALLQQQGEALAPADLAAAAGALLRRWVDEALLDDPGGQHAVVAAAGPGVGVSR
jgi:hypothetical protein